MDYYLIPNPRVGNTQLLPTSQIETRMSYMKIAESPFYQQSQDDSQKFTCNGFVWFYKDELVWSISGTKNCKNE